MLEEIQEVEKECQKRRQEIFACEHESNQTLKTLETAICDAKKEIVDTENALKETKLQLNSQNKEVTKW